MNLEISHLSCGYSPGHAVVEDINFTLTSGEICAILGQNGVGKSTLFKTILNLLKPIMGKITINGEDTRSFPPRRMAAVAAYVAQNHTPSFPYLTEEIVMLGRMGKMGVFGQPGRKDREIVDGVLAQLGLEPFRHKPYTEISGGERQMVLLARALVQEPQLLILDEPTAHLDYGNKVRVMETIQRLSARGICVIFTSHDPEYALLLDVKTLLLCRDPPALFGSAAHVVTEKNLKRAYQADIRVVEIIDEGRPKRICLPVRGQRSEVRSQRSEVRS
jgi:iron complex transport system ATP-binding protein